jgi:predicted NUDIX family NTP pyrophosphohydrolase
MKKQSAGLLIFRRKPQLEVLLVHPGGPFWARRDVGAWSIPKGEFTDESPLEAAIRETAEELGHIFRGTFLPLRSIRQSSGKTIHAWALEADFNPKTMVCNTFEIEWPPKSGRRQSFPEVDRAEWFDVVMAKEKILGAQVPLLEQLVELDKDVVDRG